MLFTAASKDGGSIFNLSEKRLSKKPKLFYFENATSLTGIQLRTTSNLYDCIVNFYRKKKKKKDWNGAICIRMGFGRRGKDQDHMMENDLISNDFFCSQTTLDSPAVKLLAKDKQIESNLDPIEIRAFLRQVYFDDNVNNQCHHGFTV